MARLTGLAPVLIVPVNQGEQPRPDSEVVLPDLFDVYLWVDDVAELEQRGADLLHAPIERPWRMLEIRVLDPNGYILAFGERIED